MYITTSKLYPVILRAVIALLLLVSYPVMVFAGDEPETYLGDDSVIMFTATVLNAGKETIDLKVVRKIKGDISENQTLPLPYFEFNSRKDTKPRVNENCFITMKDGKVIFSIQTTTTDPKTLKFVNHLTNKSMNMSGQSVCERIEQYVNDGSYEAAEKRRQSRITSEAAMPKATEKVAPSGTVNQIKSENKVEYDYYLVWIFTAFGFVILAGLILVFKKRLKKDK